jgi:hypothetical protein
MNQPTSSILSGKTVYVPFGGFLQNIGSSFWSIIFAAGGFIFPLLVKETWAFVVGWIISGLFIFVLIMIPITVAMDVSERIPEVKAARESDESLKKLEIRHPYLWVIVLLTIASFWSVIGWFVALAWACSPGRVVIPDNIYNVVFSKSNPQDQHADLPLAATDSKLNETKGLESDLIEINQLLEKDLITKEEAEKRRGLILNR